MIDHETVKLEEVQCDPALLPYFEKSSVKHHHLCPRQVIGVRIGLAGPAAIGMEIPRKDKKMLVITETDGCFISGVEAATGCFPNRRTLRIVDYGRIAATFINIKTEEAVRVTPQLNIREKAWAYARQGEKRRYFAMLLGYQRMPIEEMLHIEPVTLSPSAKSLISRPGVRVDCAICGEEIINQREVIINDKLLCMVCAHGGYYTR